MAAGSTRALAGIGPTMAKVPVDRCEISWPGVLFMLARVLLGGLPVHPWVSCTAEAAAESGRGRASWAAWFCYITPAWLRFESGPHRDPKACHPSGQVHVPSISPPCRPHTLRSCVDARPLASFFTPHSPSMTPPRQAPSAWGAPRILPHPSCSLRAIYRCPLPSRRGLVAYMGMTNDAGPPASRAAHHACRLQVARGLPPLAGGGAPWVCLPERARRLGALMW